MVSQNRVGIPTNTPFCAPITTQGSTSMGQRHSHASMTRERMEQSRILHRGVRRPSNTRTLSRQLKLVTLHCAFPAPQCPAINSTEELLQQYPDQFDRIGNFPRTYHIVLKDEALPTISAPRKCPIKLKDELQAELDSMEQ